mmetsp:Transcript_22329/g.19830  ORF Transcript_22329/g.19830 Transcript_22329/m.19830 type:complete len:149 (+) Transcript_22329:179-625(+)
MHDKDIQTIGLELTMSQRKTSWAVNTEELNEREFLSGKRFVSAELKGKKSSGKLSKILVKEKVPPNSAQKEYFKRKNKTEFIQCYDHSNVEDYHIPDQFLSSAIQHPDPGNFLSNQKVTYFVDHFSNLNSENSENSDPNNTGSKISRV